MWARWNERLIQRGKIIRKWQAIEEAAALAERERAAIYVYQVLPFGLKAIVSRTEVKRLKLIHVALPSVTIVDRIQSSIRGGH